MAITRERKQRRFSDNDTLSVDLSDIIVAAGTTTREVISYSQYLGEGGVPVTNPPDEVLKITSGSLGACDVRLAPSAGALRDFMQTAKGVSCRLYIPEAERPYFGFLDLAMRDIDNAQISSYTQDGNALMGGNGLNVLHLQMPDELTVSSLTVSAGTATCVTLTPHGLNTGDSVVFKDVTVAGWDSVDETDSFPITVVDAYTFTFPKTGSPSSGSDGSLTLYLDDPTTNKAVDMSDIGGAFNGVFLPSKFDDFRVGINAETETGHHYYLIDFFANIGRVPIVVLTFDDMLATHYSYLRPLLEANDIPASFSIYPSDVPTGDWTAANINAMHDTGLFDFLMHGVRVESADNYTQLTTAQLRNEIETQRAAVTSNGLPTGTLFTHLVLPQGEWESGTTDGDNIITILQGYGYQYFRNSNKQSSNADVGLAGASLPSVSLGNASRQIGDASDAALWVENLIRSNSDGIIRGHDFPVSSPGSGEITQLAMTAIIDYLVEQRDSGNIRLMNLGEYVSFPTATSRKTGEVLSGPIYISPRGSLTTAPNGRPIDEIV